MNKKTNKIETPNKVKKGFRLYACTVLCVALMTPSRWSIT